MIEKYGKISSELIKAKQKTRQSLTLEKQREKNVIVVASNNLTTISDLRFNQKLRYNSIMRNRKTGGREVLRVFRSLERNLNGNL